ncbi:DUF397 domain-containing protein [Streptomyces sp. NPDC001941]|uniref:DUF397 domain-containing protein n=1 Tax=Streptomyces sp. NPDC001941 TaxID=3154659 RepID=UPI00332352F8
MLTLEQGEISVFDDQPGARTWFKSSHSAGGENDCVEVARGRASVSVRDSWHRRGPVLVFPADAWRGFLAGLASPGGACE